MRMRIMLSQSSSGLRVPSGGFLSNFHLMRVLKESNHSVLIVGQFHKEDLEKEGIEYKTEIRALLEDRYRVESYSFRYKSIKMTGCEVGVIGHPLEGDDCDNLERGEWLKVVGNVNSGKFRALEEYIKQVAEEFRPTHFISNESTSLKISFEFPVIRVFIIHATEHLPFGPYKNNFGFGSYGSDGESKRLQQADLVISVSEAVKQYALRWGQLNSTVIHNHPALYGQPPFLDFTNNYTDGKYISAINVGGCKGFEIFRQVAQRMPVHLFAVVCAWAVNEDHKKVLRTLGNVVLFDPFQNMDELWRQTKVLLVPSVWFEAFGLVVVEAMLRGIPVICSDSGGLPEAKLGVEYIVKVKHVNDKSGEHDVTEWIEVLRRLLSNRDHYLYVAKRSREAAHRYLESFDRRMHEKALLLLYETQQPQIQPQQLPQEQLIW